MLHQFDKHSVHGAKLGKRVKKYMLNKQRKFGIKIFFHYVNIAIFLLGYFFLNRPVESYKITITITTTNKKTIT